MAETPRVLVSLIDEGQEYQALQAREARAAGERLGLQITVVHCGRMAALQARQIEDALAAPAGARPVAVVAHPLSVPALEPVARAAVQAGVGWVSEEPADYLDALRRANPGKLVAVVATDGKEMGRLQARIVRALLPRGGKVLHLEGAPLSPATVNRRDGLVEGLRDSGVEVAKTLRGDWSEESGQRATELWLRMGRPSRPDLVVAQNDMMAAGARKALQALKPEWLDVPVTGFDGLRDGGQRMVREKLLAATVIQPPAAGPAVELVACFLGGQEVPPSTILPPGTFPPIEELEASRGQTV